MLRNFRQSWQLFHQLLCQITHFEALAENSCKKRFFAIFKKFNQIEIYDDRPKTAKRVIQKLGNNFRTGEKGIN